MVLTFVSPIFIVNLVNTGDDNSIYEKVEDLGEEEEGTKENCDSKETVFFDEELRFFGASKHSMEALTLLPSNDVTQFINNVELEVQTPPPRTV